MTPTASEGQRLLSALKESGAEIARRVGVTRMVVSYWRSGKRAPEADLRATIEREFAIPAEAWDRGPGTKAKVPAKRPEVLPAGERAPSDEATELEAEIAYTRKLAHDEDVVPAVRVRYQHELNRLLIKQADLRVRERERSAKVVEEPAFVRVMTEVFEAIVPWPEALRAVREAITERRNREVGR